MTSTGTSSNAKSFSLTINASKTKSASSLTKRPLTSGISNGSKRPHSSLHESDNEDEVIETQLVTGFDHAAGGAIGIDTESGSAKKTPLVITRLQNRDWREESRRRRQQNLNLLPREVREAQRRRNGDVTAGDERGEEVVNGTSQSYGLTFVRRDQSSTEKDDHDDAAARRDDRKEVEEPQRQKTEDELALEALTSDKSNRKSNLVLPALETQDYISTTNGLPSRAYSGGVSEDDAFRADVHSRPDPATLDDYAAVPVEEFGAALLRGMGWKEGDVVGKRKDVQSKPRIVERRPALLGLGAKEVPGAVEELGAWGKAAATKKGKRKPDLTYNPVVLRNSKTGEMLTEEELKGRIEEEKKKVGGGGEEEDWRERRDRNLRLDRERKDRDREGRDGRSRSRDRERRRDRDRDGRSNSRHDFPPFSSSPSSPSTSKRDHHSQNHSSHHSSPSSSDNRHRRYDDDTDDNTGGYRREYDHDHDSSSRRDRDRDRNRDGGDRERERDRDRDRDRTRDGGGDRDRDSDRDRAKRQHDRSSRYNDDDHRYDSSASAASSSRRSGNHYRDSRQGQGQGKRGSEWRRREGEEEEVY